MYLLLGLLLQGTERSQCRTTDTHCFDTGRRWFLSAKFFRLSGRRSGASANGIRHRFYGQVCCMQRCTHWY